MDKEKKYGFIYITTNNINKKSYIGKKKYVKGWEDYLGSGIVLNNAIKKYGKENFSRKIIEECTSRDELNQREIYWIEFYNAVENRNFYNIASGGDGGNTIAGYNDEQRYSLSKKLSDLRKGNINLGSSNGMARPVICLNTMEVFDTTIAASIAYHISSEAIQQCCNPKSRLRTAGEVNGVRLQWAYYNKDEIYEYTPFKRKYKYKKIKCISNGAIYENIHKASKHTGCSINGIRQCCNGFIKKTKGFSFQYI